MSIKLEVGICRFAFRLNLFALSQLYRSHYFSQMLVELLLIISLVVAQDNSRRERLPGEIIPVKAELSLTRDANNEGDKAFDLDFNTQAVAHPPTNYSSAWIKLGFDKVYCIRQIMRYSRYPVIWENWICSGESCSCTGMHCHMYEELAFEIESREEESHPQCHTASMGTQSR